MYRAYIAQLNKNDYLELQRVITSTLEVKSQLFQMIDIAYVPLSTVNSSLKTVIALSELFLTRVQVQDA